MPPKFDLIGIIVQDMAASLNFYRQLGFTFPAGAESEGHVEATLPGGLRMAWDSVETIRSFDPHWSPPAGGHRVGLAFLCDGPAEVDSVYARMVDQGFTSHKTPWDAFWGAALCSIARPGWQRR